MLKLLHYSTWKDPSLNKITIIALVTIAHLFIASSVYSDNALPHPENIVKGAKAQFDPLPNFPACSDNDDSIQLTDGLCVTGQLWSQKGSVGWGALNSMVTITFDFNKVMPISGISYNTAAGESGVKWPSSILVVVSDNGSTWKKVGDLVQLAQVNPYLATDRYGVYQYKAENLACHGQYVRLVVASQGKNYIFCDEIEMYIGPDALLSSDITSFTVSDFEHYMSIISTNNRISNRISSDIETAVTDVQSSKILNEDKAILVAKLYDMQTKHSNPVDPDTFETIFPLNVSHAQVLSVYAPIMRSNGIQDLFVWKKHRFDYQTLTEIPQVNQAVSNIKIRMMRNERRSDAFLVSNATDNQVNASLQVVGLPGGPKPVWLRVYSIPWTDTASGMAIAAALVDAPYANSAFQIMLPSGMTRKIWITVDSSKLKAGDYSGTFVIKGAGKTIKVPVNLHVSPVTMLRPRLSFYAWEYAGGDGNFGVTNKNKDSVRKLAVDNLLDSPWAHPLLLPVPAENDFNENNKLKISLDFKLFDEWVKQWPNARRYMVYAHLQDTFAGKTMGTPDFDARAGEWIKALSNHLKFLKIDSKRFILTILDEPRDNNADRIVIGWIKTIKSVAPDMLIWEDPIRAKTEESPEIFSSPDIVCPNLLWYYSGGDASMAQLQDILKKTGHKLHFYQCDGGGVKTYDPHQYYRMMSWYAFRHGAEGIGFWSLGDNGGANSSWNEYDWKSYAGGFTPEFLSTTAATDSIHMQGIREGIEDYEYLSMLKDRIKTTTNPKWKLSAQSLLDEIYQVVTTKYIANYTWNATVDRTLVDSYRLKVMALLEKKY